MDDIVFTEDEIKEQLEQFGYRNVPVERLKEFKRGNCLTNTKTVIIINSPGFVQCPRFRIPIVIFCHKGC